MAKKRKRKSRKGQKILFAVELLVLLVLIVGVFAYAQINKKLDAAQGSGEDTSDVSINDKVVQDETLQGYQNILLAGVDVDEINSDTLIIASINNDTKEVKLVSVYRDTYLCTNSQTGEFNKANNAYAVGGVKQMLSMINNNLDMNITDYVRVNFDAVAEVVDQMGGIEITMTADEAVHTNSYSVEVSETTGREYEKLPKEDGTYKLNGVQAVSYARVRYTAGNDFKRAARQRLVIEKIVDKAKSSSIPTLTKVMDVVFPLIETNLSKSQIIKMASGMLSYSIGGTSGFPTAHYEIDVNNKDVVLPVTLEYNVQELHKYLFGDENYVVSDTVKKFSDEIANDSGYGSDYIEKAKDAAAAANPPETDSEADNA
ncbi:MAG: LCP family protein [Lachnospiraceae bacterium]|nr:LCP family protein [Lachnospiraceae bacterium]